MSVARLLNNGGASSQKSAPSWVLSVPLWDPGHYESAYRRFITALRSEQVDVIKLELPGARVTADRPGPDLAGWVREPAGQPYAAAALQPGA